MDKLTVRTREAAKMLSISERHLFNMAKEGFLPFVKVGGSKLFLVEDILARLRIARQGSIEIQKGTNDGIHS